jgi:hypothetical protein
MGEHVVAVEAAPPVGGHDARPEFPDEIADGELGLGLRQ